MKTFIRQVYHFLNPKFQNFFLDYKLPMTPTYGHGAELSTHKGLYELISQNAEAYASLLDKALELSPNIANLAEDCAKRNITFDWINGFFPGLDIVLLYTIICDRKPNRIIEIGSGTSTIISSQVIHDHGLKTELWSIDPHPRRDIDHLPDQIFRVPLHEFDRNVGDLLDEGDVLFVDGSHRLLPNSDVMVFFLEILPNLKPGVLVHIHDIYIPYDYPAFMCERLYSEQYALCIALLSNPKKFNVISPNYFISEDKDLKNKISSMWSSGPLATVERHGGSFWFEIVS